MPKNLCSVLHFYNLKSSLSQPQQMVVPEIDEPFVPIPDDLLVNLSESRMVVEALLDSLPSNFEGTTQVKCLLHGRKYDLYFSSSLNVVAQLEL